MPNYLYRCGKCDFKDMIELPISWDPGKSLSCDNCHEQGSMTRRMTTSSFTMGNDNTLGKWYKKNTGKELLGDS